MTHLNDAFQLTLSTKLLAHPDFSYVGHPMLVNCNCRISHVSAVTAVFHVNLPSFTLNTSASFPVWIWLALTDTRKIAVVSTQH